MEQENVNQEQKKQATPFWVDFVKYPIITGCVILILLVVRWGVGYDEISVGTDGFVLKKAQETQQVTSELQAQIQTLECRIDSLIGKPDASKANTTSVQPSKVLQQTTKFEIANDALASLSYADEKQASTFLNGTTGYIWIGNYNVENKAWESLNITSENASLLTPGNISARNTYTTTQNLMLRSSAPRSGKAIGEGNLGIVPSGVKVKIKSSPTATTQDNIVQYWAEVTVLE